MKSRSDSDRILAAVIKAETGVVASSWQIERWRQHGLLPIADRTYPGSGSLAIYSPRGLAQAVELARLSRRYTRYSELTLVLFYKGFDIDLVVLRKVYSDYLDRIERWIGVARTDRDLDKLDRFAQRVARYASRTRIGRRVVRRLRGSEESPEGIAAGVYYGLLHLIRTGSASSDEGFSELLSAFGLSGLYEDRLGDVGPIAPGGEQDLREFLSEMSLPNVRRILSHATIDDFREAARLVRTSMPFLVSVAAIATRVIPVKNAFGFSVLADLQLDELDLAKFVPFALTIAPHARSDGARQLLAAMDDSEQHFRQAAEVISSLPTSVTEALKDGDLAPIAALPEEQRQRIINSAKILQVGTRRFSLDTSEPPASD